jgi:hypothetical protein
MVKRTDTSKGPLTARGLASLKPGQWASDPGARGAGRLQAYKLTNGGLAWYYRYTLPTGKRDSLPIGTDLTLAEARQVFAQLCRRYQAGERDLRAALQAERAAAEEARRRAAEAELASKAKAAATLGTLLTAYWSQLEKAGKVSHRSVKNSLERHVKLAWPTLWAKPAVEVDADDLLLVIARLVNQGILREAAKVRSFIRAAYAAAIAARHDPVALPQLRALKVTANPARDLATIEGHTTPGERNLSLAELRAYWKHISDPAFHYGPLLRFHLLTGAQRIRQLARATTADIDWDISTIRLYDKKGRRKKPREHDVPLTPDAIRAMKEMGSGPYVFSLTGGLTPATSSGIRDAVMAANDRMADSGELEGGRFTPSDLRRTVETRLAAEGISQEDRGHLQSHGLGGVQSRHYDRYRRIDETRAALLTLRRILDPTDKAMKRSSTRV